MQKQSSLTSFFGGSSSKSKSTSPAGGKAKDTASPAKKSTAATPPASKKKKDSGSASASKPPSTKKAKVATVASATVPASPFAAAAAGVGASKKAPASPAGSAKKRASTAEENRSNGASVEDDLPPPIPKRSRKSSLLESSDEEESIVLAELAGSPAPPNSKSAAPATASVQLTDIADELPNSAAPSEKDIESAVTGEDKQDAGKRVSIGEMAKENNTDGADDEEKEMGEKEKKKEEEKEEEEEEEEEDDDDSASSSMEDPTPASKKAKATAAAAAAAKPAKKKAKVDDKLTYYSAKHHDPVKDAIWTKGKPVPYMALANVFEKIEGESGRMRTVELLSDLFRSLIVLSPENLIHAVYLSLNRIAPAYAGLELGIGESIIMKAIVQATGKTLPVIKQEMEKLGDLGSVARNARTNQRVIFEPARHTLTKVFAKLRELAEMSGNSSQQQKCGLIQQLIVAGKDCESKFLVRSVQGKLRIGLAEKSVLSALARAVVLTPPPTVVHDSAPVNVEPIVGEVEVDAPKADDSKTKIGKQKEKDSSKSKKKPGPPPTKLELAINEAEATVRTAYSELPSFDKLVAALLSTPLHQLHTKCHLTPGIPVSPMLAQPTRGVSEVLDRLSDCEFTCEWKYDGERAQIHFFTGPGGEGKPQQAATTNIYSRNAEDHTSKYPDVIRFLGDSIGEDVNSFILDSEVVAWDAEAKKILPFQQLSTRARKNVSEGDIRVQVCLFVFDLLYFNGESLLRKPLKARREILHRHFRAAPGQFEFATAKDLYNVEDIQEFLEDSIKGSCEGLMVKTLEKDATYEPSRRSFTWLKLKKDYMEGMGDSCDLVPIGAYHGKGKRKGVYGGYLLACYDEESENYQTVCKIGTGFSDEVLTQFTERLKKTRTETAPSYYQYSDVHRPDVWLSPTEVWEIKAADLSISPVHPAAAGRVDETKGIALRFPRFVRLREDKSPEMATNSEQLAQMYLNQSVVSSNNNNESTTYRR